MPIMVWHLELPYPNPQLLQLHKAVWEHIHRITVHRLENKESGYSSLSEPFFCYCRHCWVTMSLCAQWLLHGMLGTQPSMTHYPTATCSRHELTCTLISVWNVKPQVNSAHTKSFLIIWLEFNALLLLQLVERKAVPCVFGVGGMSPRIQ